jgi:hypothetical protein
MANSPIYPRTLAIGLALSPPGPTDPGAEVAAKGYARQTANFALSNEQSGALTNTATVQWPRATSLWGTVGWLTVWAPDGTYAGWGGLVTVSDGVTRPAAVRINPGDMARFAIGALLATDRNGPSLYGVRQYGVGLYSAGVPAPPRPYSRASYSAGPYSRGAHVLNVVGVMGAAFVTESPCCPDAATWTPLAPCSGGAWLPSAACAGGAWPADALP